MKRVLYFNVLGVVVVVYLGVDYLREIFLGLYEILRFVIWGVFVVVIVCCVLNYDYWI